MARCQALIQWDRERDPVASQSPLTPRKSASAAETTGGSRLPGYPGGPQAGEEALRATPRPVTVCMPITPTITERSGNAPLTRAFAGSKPLLPVGRGPVSLPASARATRLGRLTHIFVRRVTGGRCKQDESPGPWPLAHVLYTISLSIGRWELVSPNALTMSPLARNRRSNLWTHGETEAYVYL